MQAQPGVTLRSRIVPGDGLLHPIALVSIVVLIVNDHYLKSAYPGIVTGKLSDFAGLIFFPLFLQGVWEVGESVVSGSITARRSVLIVAIGITALAFAAIKLLEPVNGAASEILAFVVASARFALDPTDLVALPALAVAYLVGRKRFSDRRDR